ncbi:MAG: hypothetical protein ABI742_02470 [Gemmatimonadota bacterium]
MARFLLSRSHFAATKGRVKFAAFLPGPEGALSMYAVQGLADPAVWELGDRWVAAPATRTVHARAELESRLIREPLRIELDDDPPRHRSVIGWLAEASEQQQLALELANAARLLMRSA